MRKRTIEEVKLWLGVMSQEESDYIAGFAKEAKLHIECLQKRCDALDQINGAVNIRSGKAEKAYDDIVFKLHGIIEEYKAT